MVRFRGGVAHYLTRRYVNGVIMKFPDGVVLIHIEALEDQDFCTFADDLNRNSIPLEG